MSPPDPILAEARDTTRRVARTFSLACRLLPRDVRDDVYRLYLVFRTLDDLVDFGDPRATREAISVLASSAPATRWRKRSAAWSVTATNMVSYRTRRYRISVTPGSVSSVVPSCSQPWRS